MPILGIRALAGLWVSLTSKKRMRRESTNTARMMDIICDACCVFYLGQGYLKLIPLQLIAVLRDQEAISGSSV
jgi:hypothetical protein